MSEFSLSRIAGEGGERSEPGEGVATDKPSPTGRWRGRSPLSRNAGEESAAPTTGMTWLTGIVVYVLVWWVTLFAILPLWVTPAEPGDPGHAAGAPQQPFLARKLALTSAVAAVIWLGIYIVVAEPWLSFRGS